MARISVYVEVPDRSISINMQLPDDMPINMLILNLVSELNLPEAEKSNTVTYSLKFPRIARNLGDNETLASLGVRSDDRLQVRMQVLSVPAVSDLQVRRLKESFVYLSKPDLPSDVRSAVAPIGYVSRLIVYQSSSATTQRSAPQPVVMPSSTSTASAPTIAAPATPPAAPATPPPMLPPRTAAQPLTPTAPTSPRTVPQPLTSPGTLAPAPTVGSATTTPRKGMVKSRIIGAGLLGLLLMLLVLGIWRAGSSPNAVASLPAATAVVGDSAAMTAPPPRESSSTPAPGQATTVPAQPSPEPTADLDRTQTASTTALLLSPLSPCAVSAPALDFATSCYDPNLEATLLESGYIANKAEVVGGIRLIASNTDKPIGVWSRDLDYATSGYSYILNDMTVLRDSISLLLDGVKPDGVAPEGRFSNQKDYVYGNAWDSAPNLIHAVYAYVAKTGDGNFYHAHRDTLQQMGMWIVGLDTDNNGLPDHDTFPYGYYNSTRNTVQHTYALAKFYAAFNELAELERKEGQNGTGWEDHGRRLREAFHRPFDQGGYWLADQPWPIAWRGGGEPVKVLETFGVFEAVRTGLISRDDGSRYDELVKALHTNLPQMIDGPAPLRLTLGGYDPDLIRKDVTPSLPKWKLDASAPWVVGLAAPAYAAAGYPQDAQAVLEAYMNVARAGDIPRLIAGPNARYGEGKEGEGGTWERAAWFMAVYSGHYGLIMTPDALVVQPYPFVARDADGVRNLTYQGAVVQLAIDSGRKIYSIKADHPMRAILRPIGGAQRIRVDGGTPQAQAAMLLDANHEYIVVSEGGS